MSTNNIELVEPSNSLENAVENLNHCGAAILKNVVSAESALSLIPQLPSLDSAAGTRTLLSLSIGQSISAQLLPIAQTILGMNALAVRGILFDKSAATNWNLGFHQDTKIAVKVRHEVNGFSHWSIKEGIPHCRPPVEVLENMVAIRLHLDNNDETNGPLLISPSTHKLGLISASDTNQLVENHGIQMCLANAGDCVLMRPLTLHASFKSTSERHRRVIHIEFAAGTLPLPLQWAYA